MSTAHTHLSYNDYAAGGYASNVAHAARGLLAALFAVKPRAEVQALEAQRYEEATYLSRMADDYEHIAPNLSAELRFMASRG
ncbi:MAG TPA: hypothetical protein VJ752_04060 [Burkholderiaceae bacterium]|nr:hypothetical protein [Burkholderiaceae bacterium]